MNWLHKILDWTYWKFSGWILPGQLNSQYRYLEELEKAVRPGSRWLDLGCGHQIVPGWTVQAHTREERLTSRAGQVVGVDYDHLSLTKNNCHHVKMLASIESLPFAEDSFDLVSANMVAEHVADPNALLAEVSRVLRPGGVMIFHTPNYCYPLTLLATLFPQWVKDKIVYLLDGRVEDDVFPVHYRMNTIRRIRQLCEVHGLETYGLEGLNSSADTARLGPLVIIELLFMRLTRLRYLRQFRSNIIATLRMAGCPNTP